MSYKCYKCGKILDDKAPSYDRYDTNRIKVASNKNKNETVNKSSYLISILYSRILYL